MNARTVPYAVLIAFLLGTPQAVGQGPPGGPLADLERRIADLESRLGPLEVAVDCSAGERVADALQTTADHVGPLTITLSGFCLESVRLARDGVTLRGLLPGAGLEAASPFSAALLVEGARRIRLEQLVLRGGDAGLLARGDTSVEAVGVTIKAS